MTELRVLRQGRSVRLEAPEGTFSFYHPDRLFTELAWDALTASLLLTTRTVRSALILGLGGGTTARQCRALFPEAQITGVEIDSDVLDIARRDFALDSIGVHALHQPGQVYLRGTRRRFDGILDDMWPARPGGPKPFRTEGRWGRLVASRLGPGGVYALNVYRPSQDRREYPAALSLLRDAFPTIYEVRPLGGPTTVLAAGAGIRSAREARAALRRLPAALARRLRTVSFRTLN